MALWLHSHPAPTVPAKIARHPQGKTLAQSRDPDRISQPRPPSTCKCSPPIPAGTAEPWSPRHHEMRPPSTRKALAAPKSQPRPRPDLPAEEHRKVLAFPAEEHRKVLAFPAEDHPQGARLPSRGASQSARLSRRGGSARCSPSRSTRKVLAAPLTPATQPGPSQPRPPSTRKVPILSRDPTRTALAETAEPWSLRHHEMRPPSTRKALAALRSQPRPRPDLPAETQTGPPNPRPRPVLPAETAVHPGQDRRVPSPRRTETRLSSTHKVGSPPRTQPRPPCISKALARQNPAEITEHPYDARLPEPGRDSPALARHSPPGELLPRPSSDRTRVLHLSTSTHATLKVDRIDVSTPLYAPWEEEKEV